MRSRFRVSVEPGAESSSTHGRGAKQLNICIRNSAPSIRMPPQVLVLWGEGGSQGIHAKFTLAVFSKRRGLIRSIRQRKTVVRVGVQLAYDQPNFFTGQRRQPIRASGRRECSGDIVRALLQICLSGGYPVRSKSARRRMPGVFAIRKRMKQSNGQGDTWSSRKRIAGIL